MALAHVLTLTFVLALAGAATTWAVAELRRDTKLRRFALISGPFGGGTYWAAIPPVVLVGPLLYAVFAFQLVPKESPGLYALILGCITVACVAAIIAGVTVQLRRNALGWLTLVGENTLELDAEGTRTTLKLQAGTARLYFIAPQYAQFVISHDAVTITVWGMISIRGMKDITESEPVAAHGLMLAGSAEPLRKWLSPFIDRR